MPAQLQRILMKLRYRSFTTRTVPGGLECRRKKKMKKREHEEEEDEEEKKKQEKKKTKKEQPRSFHAKWRFRSTGITLNLRIG